MRTALLVVWIVAGAGAAGFACEDEGRHAPRSPMTTSRVVGSPEPPAPYRAVKAFPNLIVEQPLTFEQEPGAGAYLILQHLGGWAPPGRLLRAADDPGVDRFDVLLDFGPTTIAYGLDFHPDYVRNGFLYVGMNAQLPDETHVTRVVRYMVDRRPPFAIDTASALTIIEWESNGHNGGDVAFGGDGMLYVSSGDGTADSDLNDRGQDLAHLTAKILRIDVDRPAPGAAYSSPPDNPFAHIPGARPETWAMGLRNPWRLSYDRATGQLWTGVNGQDLWETVNLVERGANYGWSVTEGSRPFLPGRKLAHAPLTPPTVEHHHSEARSLTGGLVYHGSRHPELKGAYVYGDYSTGKVWGVKVEGGRKVFHREIADTPLQLTGFGLDSAGELILIDHRNAFHRLVPSPPEDAEASARFPRRLSETGLFASTPDRTPAPGAVPYDVNAPLWSDGALKERFLAVPGLETIEYAEPNGWTFPDRTVLVKTFLYDLADDDRDAPAPIETRLMVKEQGEWTGYTYAWNDERTDAILVAKEGLDRTFRVRTRDGGGRDQAWRYPSRAECMVCHSRASNFVLGLCTPQMNRDFDHGAGPENQVDRLHRLGFFANEPPRREGRPRLADPRDASATLEARARAYLHANCASCHVEAGGGNAAIDLTAGAPPHRLGVHLTPQQDALAAPGAKILAPGDPEGSTLLSRVASRGPGQMPPLATNQVDDDAVALLRAWIAELPDPGPPPHAQAPSR
ncbi:PQQ-dependent sugar dehydrogenase [Paludisphaera soli]|uniref:PQQ-dependent sugar dehydrogenase n=1 Tax=Paludisphaera soli TaxID=2712865 RepID=UPI0013ED3310|nr:PQQ-dependent sugar dehydrogenase [Paludisphaera soli]